MGISEEATGALIWRVQYNPIGRYMNFRIPAERTTYPYNLPLYYAVCPHQEAFKFQQNAPLLRYLKNHCEGFVQEPNDIYTVNYIAIVLIENWERSGVLCHDRIVTNHEIKKAFKTGSHYLYTDYLRRRIYGQLQISEVMEKHFLYSDMEIACPPLWCVSEEIREMAKCKKCYPNECSYPRTSNMPFCTGRWNGLMELKDGVLLK